MPHEMKKLLDSYNEKKEKRLEDIIDFHYRFEKNSSFQDGNGRVGRLIILKSVSSMTLFPL
ncbi:Fic family protein [Peptoniphilus harei]|uniref:Fic family protein n=1 Tax=Peptoniphilus harei TaxID=54005 RepID=UPI0039089B9E